MVIKLTATQKKAEAKTLGKWLRYVRVEKLVDTLAWTLAEVEA